MIILRRRWRLRTTYPRAVPPIRGGHTITRAMEVVNAALLQSAHGPHACPRRLARRMIMPPHGIAELRGYLAKLPPAESVAERRAMYDRAERVFKLPPDTAVESVTAGGRPAEWIRAAVAREDAALLYLHGGGYVIGSARSHRHLAAALARAAGVSCLLPDYRLAPEHPFPAAVDDAVAAYRWLVEQRTIAPGRIAIGGDSAGGGLAVAALVAIRGAGLPLPGAGVCISPWT